MKPAYEGRDGMVVRFSAPSVEEVVVFPIKTEEGERIFIRKKIVRQRYQLYRWCDKKREWVDAGLHYGKAD